METQNEHAEFEQLNTELQDDTARAAYQAQGDGYTTAWLPSILGWLVVTAGNLVFGHEPSYLKFRAVEVIARVPYHSWHSAMFTLQTLYYSNESRAMSLSQTAQFARLAAENETMHVIVISQLAQQGGQYGNAVVHTAIPMLFAFFYFWASYILYMIRPKYSYQLNYLFEDHAYDSYSRFLELHGEELKKKSIDSKFLRWYGRHPANQYEFFVSVRNDELIHRNKSMV
jgi:ubiquinol oxidase